MTATAAGHERVAVRARRTLTRLRVPESAGIKIRIQVIRFRDPFLRTLTKSPGSGRKYADRS
ncbi:hypothetical protein [Arthrobacter oryzae]|uniref:hypothetical protein n=1 Tax=Arthrobacter oryzae TaxID=409290 RepID=UPI00278993C5|nr:hypothetical protein [Arthrobacter oryzae]MDQ0075125.1 hypothetical protein [Arthrobacter oryzae]